MRALRINEVEAVSGGSSDDEVNVVWIDWSLPDGNFNEWLWQFDTGSSCVLIDVSGRVEGIDSLGRMSNLAALGVGGSIYIGSQLIGNVQSAYSSFRNQAETLWRSRVYGPGTAIP